MIQKLVEIVKTALPTWTPVVIWDVGSLDGKQSLELARAYPEALVWAFEPNPDSYQVCCNNTTGEKRITCVPFALSGKWGIFDYHRMKTSNAGAGSLYQPSGEYDGIEKMPFDVIKVPVITLHAAFYMVDSVPDLMWLDMQGSELSMLEGIDGNFPPNLRVIWTELLYGPMYFGQGDAYRLEALLGRNGFTKMYENVVVKGWYGDACFVKV